MHKQLDNYRLCIFVILQIDLVIQDTQLPFDENYPWYVLLDVAIGNGSDIVEDELMRALEEGEIQPLGDTRTHKVDVRLISATNRNLEAMVETGEFRESFVNLIWLIASAPL